MNLETRSDNEARQMEEHDRLARDIARQLGTDYPPAGADIVTEHAAVEVVTSIQGFGEAIQALRGWKKHRYVAVPDRILKAARRRFRKTKIGVMDGRGRIVQEAEAPKSNAKPQDDAQPATATEEPPAVVGAGAGGDGILGSVPSKGPHKTSEPPDQAELHTSAVGSPELSDSPPAADPFALAGSSGSDDGAASPSPNGDPRVICVINRKGGVGKTTTSFNLAGALADAGHEVLVVDLDPMGSLCRSLRVYPGELTLSELLIAPNGSMGEIIRSTHIPNLHVIPGDPNLRTFEMRHGTAPGYRVALRDSLSQVLDWKPYGFVLIDCPPSLGLISGNALVAAEEAIIPIDGSTYGMGALMDTMTVLQMVRDNVNRRLHITGLLLNNIDLGTVYDRTVREVLQQEFGGLMFSTVIPTSPEADESSELGEPVVRYAPTSWMAKAYGQLVEELASRRPPDDA